jgi:FMN-dependent NADH-azoreductase
MKTLLVTYLPRGENSHTKKLADAFSKETKGAVETLDLLQDTPDFFGRVNLESYIHRNYLGEKLDATHQKAIAKMDRMTAQFKAADIVVMAAPMHNFSLPAPIKAYFDSVMQKGATWDIRDGKYVGLMTGKKALILLASGGIYEGPMASWEHAVSLAKVEFQFMGFSDIRDVTAAGINAGKRKPEEIVAEAQEKVRAIAQEWYR